MSSAIEEKYSESPPRCTIAIHESYIVKQRSYWGMLELFPPIAMCHLFQIVVMYARRSVPMMRRSGRYQQQEAGDGEAAPV